ncbi:ubiquitin 3 binding protein But2 C-terminal domain-containing protein [Nemania sp. FL0031]|nr:ubiquitin 3 binding protein But2 C-terminal domain-containing protein [Nemania sp. FL0031]
MLQKFILSSSLLSGACALTMRQNGCSFHINTEGAFAAPVNQFDSGQARAGVYETPSNFTVSGDTITDAQGRGCWWTPPALVLQCDPGQTPEAGFSIGCDGTVSFRGQSTFYECDTGADNLTMIYLGPNGSRCGQIILRSDGCYPAGCNGSTSVTTVASGTSSTLPLGGLTSYWDLISSLPTGTGSTPTIGPSVIPPSPTNTSTLPLGGLTSYWDLISTFPAGSGSTTTVPGATGTGTGAPPGQTGTPGTSCPGTLTPGTYEFPHLIIPLDSAHPDIAPGTSYFGEVNSTISSAFNFDIPPSASKKTCTAVFYFPTQTQLETSSYNITGSEAAVQFARLSAPVGNGTSYANVPAVAEPYGNVTLAPGNAYTVAALPCPAGQGVAFEMRSAGTGGNATALRYFQDYNPCPIGLYIIVS